MSEVMGIDTEIKDYAKLAREILVRLRGDLSQLELSQKLDYKFNQVSKWETGATSFYWVDLIRVGDVLGLQPQQTFDSLFGLQSDSLGQPRDAFSVLVNFLGYSHIQQMADDFHKSRSSISRLLHSHVKVDFSDILQIMDLRPYILSRWLETFLNPLHLENFRERYLLEKKCLQTFLQDPEARLVMSAYYMEGPLTSQVSRISEKTGLLESQVLMTSQKLLDLGFLVQAQQSLQPALPASFLIALTESTLFSDILFPVSKTAEEKILEVTRNFQNQILEILKNDSGTRDHLRQIQVLNTNIQELNQEVSKNETSYPDLENS